MLYTIGKSVMGTSYSTPSNGIIILLIGGTIFKNYDGEDGITHVGYRLLQKTL
jgi:hypothetical protein